MKITECTKCGERFYAAAKALVCGVCWPVDQGIDWENTWIEPARRQKNQLRAASVAEAEASGLLTEEEVE